MKNHQKLTFRNYIQQKSKGYILFPLFLLLTICIAHDTQAQAREGGLETFQTPKERRSSGFNSDRLRFGGGIGATFGNITYIDLSPTVGYMFTDNFIAGLTTRYIYYEEKYPGYKFSTNIFGGGVFSEYFILQNITLHAEYELLNMEDLRLAERNHRINVSSLLVGGGYRMMITDRSFANILLLFNVLEDENSIYTNPIFRINFGVAF